MVVKLICISILIEVMTSLTLIVTSMMILMPLIMPNNDNKMPDSTEKCRIIP